MQKLAKFSKTFAKTIGLIGSKTYKCKVTVKGNTSSTSSSEASVSADLVDYEIYKTDDCVVGIFENNNKQAISLDVKLVYYDANGDVVGASYDKYAGCNAAGSSDTVSFSYPYDENYDTIIPASYKIYVNHAYAYNF